jgi:hypothetical protein
VNALDKYRRRHAKPLRQRPYLAHIQLSLAAQNLRDDALRADFGQVGLAQVVLLIILSVGIFVKTNTP